MAHRSGLQTNDVRRNRKGLYTVVNKALKEPSFEGGYVIPITVPYQNHLILDAQWADYAWSFEKVLIRDESKLQAHPI